MAWKLKYRCKACGYEAEIYEGRGLFRQQMLLEMVGFNEIVKGADFVITGEGAADGQTLMGKLPWGVFQHTQGVPVLLIAGQVRDKEQLKLAGFSHVECINPPDLPLQETMQKEVAKQNISTTINRIVRSKYGL